MESAYKKAGVDINAGYESVTLIKKHTEKTKRLGVMGGLGGFGGLFDLASLNIKDPILVSGTDGVGTKLKIAFAQDKHDTIGIDVVAMCVNDIVTQGAQPLFFLDYIACDKIIPSKIEAIVKGVSEGCIQAGCALLGGETAEMPGMYSTNEYDIAGFATGVVSRSNLITGERIQNGDVLLGLASSGIHSNGFSLVRKIISDNNLSLNKTYPGFDIPLGEILLTPTKIYVKAILSLMEKIEISGIAHITGGGFIENIPRIMPEGFTAAITEGSWDKPLIFSFLQKNSNIECSEMFNVFNMGIGMVIAVRNQHKEEAVSILESIGSEKVYVIGSVEEKTTNTPYKGIRFV